MHLDARAKRPLFPLIAGPYGHPFHPLLVTVPIGAWTSSLVFDIASRVAPGQHFYGDSSRLLLAIGLIGAVAAASVGLLDFLAIPARTPAARIAGFHGLLNLVIIIGYALNIAWRWNDVGPTPPGPLALSAICLVALGVSGWLGGRLTFTYGVRVAAEATQRAGFAYTQPVTDRTPQWPLPH